MNIKLKWIIIVGYKIITQTYCVNKEGTSGTFHMLWNYNRNIQIDFNTGKL